MGKDEESPNVDKQELYQQFKSEFKMKFMEGQAEHAMELFRKDIMTLFWFALFLGVLGNLLAALLYGIFLENADLLTKATVLVMVVTFVVMPFILFFSPMRKRLVKGRANTWYKEYGSKLDNYIDVNFKQLFLDIHEEKRKK